jgi:hypothetical protein
LVQVKNEKKEIKEIQKASTIAPSYLEMEILETCQHDCSDSVQSLLLHGALIHQIIQASTLLCHPFSIFLTSDYSLALHPTACQTLRILFRLGFILAQPSLLTF